MKKNQITVANETLTPDEMKKLLQEFSTLRAKIAKLPKEELKELKKEIGKRVISGKLLELKDKLVPILKEYRDDLKAEFKKTETVDKPKGNKSISFKTDIFTVAVIRSMAK